MSRVLMRDDRGENSIMQVVSIAVSAILIVAGLAVAPGLIQSSRDTNAKSDLSNMIRAQEMHQADFGEYSQDLHLIKNGFAEPGYEPRVKYLLSDTTDIVSLASSGKDEWCAVAQTSQNRFFGVTSSGKITNAQASSSSAWSGAGCSLAERKYIATPDSVWSTDGAAPPDAPGLSYKVPDSYDPSMVGGSPWISVPSRTVDVDISGYVWFSEARTGPIGAIVWAGRYGSGAYKGVSLQAASSAKGQWVPLKGSVTLTIPETEMTQVSARLQSRASPGGEGWVSDLHIAITPR